MNCLACGSEAPGDRYNEWLAPGNNSIGNSNVADVSPYGPYSIKQLLNNANDGVSVCVLTCRLCRPLKPLLRCRPLRPVQWRLALQHRVALQWQLQNPNQMR